MRRQLILLGTILILLCLLFAFEGAIEDRRPIALGPNPLSGPQNPQRISMMTYNAENLFDAKHDNGKKDMEWNEFVVRRKLRAVADVILQVHGRGPDILILQEIENSEILNRLVKDHLHRAGYISSILIEAQDPRGIDVAIVSRYPLASPARLHPIPGQARGILEAQLRLSSTEVVSVMAFHFPSQMHELAKRKIAIDKLAELISKSHLPVIAAGDSNITRNEAHLLDTFLRELGSVSHQLGCNDCRGTHYYRGQWSFLDWIFFSESLVKRVIKSSIILPAWSDLQISRQGRPIRFNEFCQRPRCLGVSDHLPVLAEIEK